MAKRQIRPIRVEGNIAYVPLTRGYEAVIDAADVPLIKDRNWTASVKFRSDGTLRAVYAIAGIKLGVRNYASLLMHRLLVGPDCDLEVDHRDGDGLNNRRQNLRVASKTENARNRRKPCNNQSGAKGVHWAAAKGKWQARIVMGGRKINLGYFDSVGEAAMAYADAASNLYGDFGRIA